MEGFSDVTEFTYEIFLIPCQQNKFQLLNRNYAVPQRQPDDTSVAHVAPDNQRHLNQSNDHSREINDTLSKFATKDKLNNLVSNSNARDNTNYTTRSGRSIKKPERYN
ncbi:hypothetical protein SNE40_005974 [Patella caerulea]|uniref:Uncharacterized protein n=1 Tax=Patella caerulea TaxID=87958 RepID=A0AAN8PZC5_PATCE